MYKNCIGSCGSCGCQQRVRPVSGCYQVSGCTMGSCECPPPDEGYVLVENNCACGGCKCGTFTYGACPELANCDECTGQCGYDLIAGCADQSRPLLGVGK